ncbi:MAG: Hsp20/alpha crystallin family protein [Minisyncoccia bacterium]|jgi:HSP20 family protein
MDASEEKFFETLAGTASDAGEQYEVELARAETVAAKPKAKPKIIESKDGGPAWDDDEPEGQLTVDVYQTPNDIVVESAIAGVRPEDIDIQVTADSISIRGSRRREKEVGDEDYLYQECYWGRFARSIILPQEVDPDGANVMFKNGILTVRLPKVNKKKSKKLKVSLD